MFDTYVGARSETSVELNTGNGLAQSEAHTWWGGHGVHKTILPLLLLMRLSAKVLVSSSSCTNLSTTTSSVVLLHRNRRGRQRVEKVMQKITHIPHNTHNPTNVTHNKRNAQNVKCHVSCPIVAEVVEHTITAPTNTPPTTTSLVSIHYHTKLT